jgi:hypothetical protein
MRRQPDFSAIFFDYFGKCPKPLSYELRFDSSLLHDLQFMSSLLHDSVFCPENMITARRRTSLTILRECWELPKVKVDGAIHLYVVESSLIISPSAEVTWCLPADFLRQGQQSALTLQHLYVGADYWDPERSGATLILQGASWTCNIRVDSKSPLVRLRDLGVPALAARQKASSD